MDRSRTLLAPLAAGFLAAWATLSCSSTDGTSSAHVAQADGSSDTDALLDDAPSNDAGDDAEQGEAGPGDADDSAAPDAADGSTPNAGWIGSACEGASDCEFAGGICLLDGYPGGMCSTGCDKYCPDPTRPDQAGTFCIEDSDSSGVCVARCDWLLFSQDGCRAGMRCKWRERIGEPWVVESVCVPDDGGQACMGDEVWQPNVGILEPAGQAGCGRGMVPAGNAGPCIDRWESHLVQILDEGGEVPWSPFFNPGDRRVRAVSAPGAVPQGYISGDQAAAACAEAGKRLCTQAEWEYACMGPEGHTYPYGDVREPGVCNDHRAEHPAVEYFGTTDSWIWSELGHACLNQLPGSLDPAGARAGCVTPSGVFDLMGNLHEWIDDPAGTFKGGFYVDTVLNGDGCQYTTTAHDTGHWDYSTGFRCCGVP